MVLAPSLIWITDVMNMILIRMKSFLVNFTAIYFSSLKILNLGFSVSWIFSLDIQETRQMISKNVFKDKRQIN